MRTSFLDHPGPLAFAHRGGAAHAPENSWRAFEHAVGLGYRYLETDVQATADGVLIAFHDRTLERVTGQPGRVGRLAYRDIGHALIDGTDPIPLLEDLLCAWPEVRFNIDVKDAPAVAPLATVLRRTNAWDRVCVVSFSASRLRATRRALDRPVCMAASPLGAAVVRFGGPRGPRDSRGPHRLTPAHATARQQAVTPEFALRLPAGTVAPSPRRLVDWLARTGVRCVQIPAAVATPSFVGRSHALGLQVHAWTVNDRPVMEHLLDIGVDGIMTDQTVALREILITRNQWHPIATPRSNPLAGVLEPLRSGLNRRSAPPHRGGSGGSSPRANAAGPGEVGPVGPTSSLPRRTRGFPGASPGQIPRAPAEPPQSARNAGHPGGSGGSSPRANAAGPGEVGPVGPTSSVARHGWNRAQRESCPGTQR